MMASMNFASYAFRHFRFGFEDMSTAGQLWRRRPVFGYEAHLRLGAVSIVRTDFAQ